MRRPSLHEKDANAISAKDARDEARHVLEMMAAANENDEDDDDINDSVHAADVKVGHAMFFVISVACGCHRARLMWEA